MSSNRLKFFILLTNFLASSLAPKTIPKNRASNPINLSPSLSEKRSESFIASDNFVSINKFLCPSTLGNEINSLSTSCRTKK